MLTKFRLLSLVAAICLATAARGAGPYGADNGWAVDHSSGAIDLTSAVANQMAKGETGWIRIEMFLIGSHTNWDSTVLGYYDSAVNNARNAGLQVLLLIDGGSWPGSQANWCQNNLENNPGFNGDNPYVGGFATNAVAVIVQHFRNRVKYYEIWNEPNCWTSNPSNGVYTGATYLYPSNYGWMLARSWQAVHITAQINDVTLFSGGLFGHDISGVVSYANCGAQYLDDTYSTGTNVAKGGSFNFVKTNYNAFPLDGIGEHLYIDQGTTVSSNTFRQYEDWVHQACTKYEGVNTPKKTFITEFGWTTASVSQALQDTNLIISFNAINATPYVQMAIWFQWADNPAGNMYYGVTNTSSGPKLAFPDYERFERFEGIYTNGTTNASIAAYFVAATNGQSVLGDPFDNGHSAWVHAFLNGYAQDFAGGSHSNLTVMTSTNGTFEMNDLHGIWDYYYTNNGASTFGYLLGNEYPTNGGTRQDFALGYMTWDSTNHIVWYPGNMSPPTGLAAVPGNAYVTLQWNADPPATSYNVKRSTTCGGTYTPIANVVGSPTFTDAGAGEVANGTTYYYVVSGVNSLGESTNSAPANATPEGGINTLPAPWQDADVGNVGLTGASGLSGSTYTLYGSGADIGGAGDAFHFVYQLLGGDGGIVARVKSEQNTSPLAKAGIMIRETLNSNATCIALLLEQTNGSHLQYRPSTGASTSDIAGPVVSAPYWLKLIRNGNSFAASAAADGVNYVPVGNVTVSMASNVLVGLAVSSHATNALNTSTFDNVSVRPTLTIGQNGVLTWGAPCILQSATNVSGPYADVVGASSPYTSTNAGLPAQFFRLRNPQ